MLGFSGVPVAPSSSSDYRFASSSCYSSWGSYWGALRLITPDLFFFELWLILGITLLNSCLLFSSSIIFGTWILTWLLFLLEPMRINFIISISKAYMLLEWGLQQHWIVGAQLGGSLSGLQSLLLWCSSPLSVLLTDVNGIAHVLTGHQVQLLCCHFLRFWLQLRGVGPPLSFLLLFLVIIFLLNDEERVIFHLYPIDFAIGHRYYPHFAEVQVELLIFFQDAPDLPPFLLIGLHLHGVLLFFDSQFLYILTFSRPQCGHPRPLPPCLFKACINWIQLRTAHWTVLSLIIHWISSPFNRSFTSINLHRAGRRSAPFARL